MEVSSYENHQFPWAIYTMAMLVITRGYTKIPAEARQFHVVAPHLLFDRRVDAIPLPRRLGRFGSCYGWENIGTSWNIEFHVSMWYV